MDVVVARSKESLQWIDEMVAGTKVTRVFVYDKQEGGAHQQQMQHQHYEPLPNVGREAHTFLHHIVKHYDDLADETVFLQGYPFDHEPSLDRYSVLMEGRCKYATYATCEPVSVHPLYYDGSCRCKALFRTVYPQDDDVTTVPDHLLFSSGAQYIVKREGIRLHPRETYAKLLEKSRTDERFPWDMERLWLYVFSESLFKK
jgi:hypothetical protein